LDEDLLYRALQRANRLGLNAVDAIHLESAITAHADEFITSEKPTKRLFSENAVKMKSLFQL